MSNIFCIGDVHGCFYTLQKLIEKLPKDAEIIFTGDLCDKGNHTKEVIDYIISENHEVIKGNHEVLMEENLLKALLKNEKNPWITLDGYGGKQTLKSYIGHNQKAVEHVEFIKNLPHYKMIDNYFITHGFGLPYFQQRDEAEKQIKRNRIYRPYKDWEDYEEYEVINIFGHCDFKEVKKGKNFFGIDTGAAYGNKLTAFELHTHKIIQQKVLDKDLK